MSKINLDSVQSGYDLSIVNVNFQKIEDELNTKVLYRDNPVGETNTLETDVDANGQRIYNLPDPTSNGEPVTLGFYIEASQGGTDLVEQIDFIPSPAPAYQEGTTWYDSDEKALSYYNDISGSSMQIGFEHWVRVRNSSGGTITDGSVVVINGAAGQTPTIALADADVHVASKVIGLVTADIANNSVGHVTILGLVKNQNTSGYADGTVLYLSQTPGVLTDTPPSGNAAVVAVGIVAHSHITQGKILVSVNDAQVYAKASDILNMLETADIGVTVQAYDVDTAKVDVAQNFTAPQRSALQTDNDGSFDLSSKQNFFCTTAGSTTLTFTNQVSGLSGSILFVNSSNHVVSAHANTKILSADLNKISSSGTYRIDYLSNGTNAYCSVVGPYA